MAQHAHDRLPDAHHRPRSTGDGAAGLRLRGGVVPEEGAGGAGPVNEAAFEGFPVAALFVLLGGGLLRFYSRQLVFDAAREVEARGAQRQHHERLDGSGYPRGLRGQEIPLLARMMGLAQTLEVFAALEGPRAALGPAARTFRQHLGRPDIAILADFFLQRFARKHGVKVSGFSEAAYATMVESVDDRPVTRQSSDAITCLMFVYSSIEARFCSRTSFIAPVIVGAFILWDMAATLSQTFPWSETYPRFCLRVVL